MHNLRKLPHLPRVTPRKPHVLSIKEVDKRAKQAKLNTSIGLCACGRQPQVGRARCVKCLGTASRRRRAIADVVDAAKSKPCVDCGCQYPPEVMDFDHVRGTRSFSLGQAIGFGMPAVLAEIAKCEVRCPTCHRLRHYNEANGVSIRVRTTNQYKEVV